MIAVSKDASEKETNIKRFYLLFIFSIRISFALCATKSQRGQEFDNEAYRKFVLTFQFAECELNYFHFVNFRDDINLSLW